LSFACLSDEPACGTWDFEDGALSGWEFGTYRELRGVVSDVENRIISASHALAVDVDGLSTNGEGSSTTLQVYLCPNEALLDLSSIQVSYDIYYMTTSVDGVPFGYSTSNDILLYDNSPIASCAFNAGSDEWFSFTCSALPAAAGRIQLVLAPPVYWVGTIFIDNIQFTNE
jgi:hypothetical protein